MELQTYHNTTEVCLWVDQKCRTKKWRTRCDHRQQIQAWKMKDQNARAGKCEMKNAGLENVGRKIKTIIHAKMTQCNKV